MIEIRRTVNKALAHRWRKELESHYGAVWSFTVGVSDFTIPSGVVYCVEYEGPREMLRVFSGFCAGMRVGELYCHFELD